MAWQLTPERLIADRDEKAAKAQEHADQIEYEGLGRAHRWLDEEVPARRWFAAAAEEIDRRIEQRGRGSADRRGQTGVLLRLAGDEDGARHWLERAIASGAAESDPQRANVAAWRYWLDDTEGCLELAGTLREPEGYGLLHETAVLARARSSGDPEPISGAVERLTEILRAERVTPGRTSGSAVGSVWDWLEEAFRVEAELRGDAVPDHATMLERAGLLKGAARRDAPAPAPAPAPDALPASGRWSVARETPDGETVDLVLVRGPEATDLKLDPRPGVELAVHVAEQFGEFRLLIEWGDDEEGWFEERLGPYGDFSEATDVAADWLRAYGPDPPGGAWAAEAIEALLAAARAG